MIEVASAEPAHINAHANKRLGNNPVIFRVTPTARVAVNWNVSITHSPYETFYEMSHKENTIMVHILYKRALCSFIISSVFSLTTAFADDLPLSFSSSTSGSTPTTATYTPNSNMAGNTLSIIPEKVVYYTKSIAVCPASEWVGSTRAGMNFTLCEGVHLLSVLTTVLNDLSTGHFPEKSK